MSRPAMRDISGRVPTAFVRIGAAFYRGEEKDMFVRYLDDIIGGERDVNWGNGQSRRLLLEADGMGFSLMDTTIKAGTDLQMQYKNHLEAVYCISGKGTITDVARNLIHDIRPGMMYALDQHDVHRVRAADDLRVICIFTPPLKGDEKHDMSKPGSSY